MRPSEAIRAAGAKPILFTFYLQSIRRRCGKARTGTLVSQPAAEPINDDRALPFQRTTITEHGSISSPDYASRLAGVA
jgi:hypothetical protein